jgi:serine protease Do
MGLSFAIPIDVVMNVADQLKADGKVSRGWLGVVIHEVNKDLAESFGMEKPAGALVVQVVEDGPGAKGGLRVGDVILSLDGQPINLSADLPHLVGGLKPGSKINLELMRDGKRRSLALKIGSLPEDESLLAEAGAGPGAAKSSSRLGLVVEDMDSALQKKLDIQGGVLVTDAKEGPAAAVGLRPGDVITHLNNQPVASAAAFIAQAKELPSQRSISMRVLREGRASFITFKLDK